MKNYERLPRKIKKTIKGNDSEKWMLFLNERKEKRKKGEHLDKLFVRDYENVYKTFHKMLRYGK